MPRTSPSPRPRRPRPRRVGRPRAATGRVRSREEILDAAVEAFAALGYEAASVRELTRRLGVSHNLVHHYFRSKADLWRAAMDHSFGAITAEIAKLLAPTAGDGDVLTLLRHGMVQFLVMTARFPANGHIIVREGATDGPRLDYIYEHFVAPNVEPLRLLLQQAQRERKARPDLDVRTLFFLLTDGGAGPYTSPGLAKRLGGPDPLGAGAVRAHAELVTDLLMRGIVTGGAR